MTVTVYDVKDGDYVLVDEEKRRTGMFDREEVLLPANRDFFAFFRDLREFGRVSVPKEFT